MPFSKSKRKFPLNAFKQVEDNLAALRILEQEAGVQARAVNTAQHPPSRSNVRYEGGVTSYLEVITAEKAALSDEFIFGRRIASAVLLIEALGAAPEGKNCARLQANVAGRNAVAPRNVQTSVQ